MRTIAQFAIRDSLEAGEAAAAGGVGALQQQQDGSHRSSFGSFRQSQIGLGSVGSTLRNVEPAPQILEQRELESQMERIGHLPHGQHSHSHDHSHSRSNNTNSRDGQTPTGPRAPHPDEKGGFDLPDFRQFGNDEDDDDTPPPGVGAKPSGGDAPEIRLAGVDWRGHAVQHHGHHGGGGGGGLHVRNASIQGEEDWSADTMAGLGVQGAGAGQNGNGKGNGNGNGRGY